MKRPQPLPRGEHIRIFEVGPRDGIQNESRPVSFEQKIELVNGLVSAGIRDLELGAFVRPDKVPQMADTDRIFESVRSKKIRLGRAMFWSLVPNRRGLERALKSGARWIAVFTATSETFNRKNIGMGVAESLREYRAVIREAHAAEVQVRGYVSTVFGCPFEGRQAPLRGVRIAESLLDAGAFQVSLGDTIGVATPRGPHGIDEVLTPAIKLLGADRLAVHFHDTRGTALANTLRALEHGIRTVDSSVGGLGGCPFAPGAAGNLATEDLVYMLHGMGLKTGIDLDRLCQVSRGFQRAIKRPVTSRYLAAHFA